MRDKKCFIPYTLLFSSSAVRVQKSQLVSTFQRSYISLLYGMIPFYPFTIVHPLE